MLVQATCACEREELLGRYPRDLPAEAGGAGAGDMPPLPSSAYRGDTLLSESFETTDLAARAWYDIEGPVVSAAPAHDGAVSFECRFEVGQTVCAGGSPGRNQFEPQQAVFVSYRVRFGEGFVGANDLALLTTEDPDVIGPALSHFSAWTGVHAGAGSVTLADNANVNPACVQLTSGEIVGCAGGDVQSWPFDESRSLNGCNGVVSSPDEWSCSPFDLSPSGYENYRSWQGALPATPGAGFSAPSGFHLVELYIRLNSVEGGVGIPNGVVRYWFDSELVIAREDVLMRTGLLPNMLIHQILLAPWTNGQATSVQTYHIDDFQIASGLQP
jgi:hypothetical protein